MDQNTVFRVGKISHVGDAYCDDRVGCLSDFLGFLYRHKPLMMLGDA